jgi:hypothetical protein
MTQQGHDSPDRAAMAGFPEAHCRVIACQSFKDDAYVLLNTSAPEQPDLYGVNCYRKDGEWFESGSGDVSGWEQRSHDPDLARFRFGVTLQRVSILCGSSLTARLSKGRFVREPTSSCGGECRTRLSGHASPSSFGREADGFF